MNRSSSRRPDCRGARSIQICRQPRLPAHPSLVCGAHRATIRLLDYYFVREQKRGGAVVELHQVHAPIQVIYLADDPWLFAETAAPFMVAHRLLQLAMFPDQYFTIYASHHIFTPPRPPCTSCFLILTDILASFGP